MTILLLTLSSETVDFVRERVARFQEAAEVLWVNGTVELEPCLEREGVTVAVVDSDHPAQSLASTLEVVRGRCPVLVLGSSANTFDAVDAMRSGALGYWERSTSGSEYWERLLAMALDGWRRFKQAREEQDALREDQSRLQSIIEGTDVGTWEWNVQTGDTRFSERWATMLGYSLSALEPLTIKTWEALAHPEDLKRVRALLEAHFSGASSYYECECRMKHADGRWIWVHDRGRVITRSATGAPLMMFGMHTDITDRKQKEMVFTHNMARLRRAEKVAGFGNWEIDLKTGIVEASESVRELYGLKSGVVTIAEIQAIPLPKYRPMLDRALWGLTQAGEDYDVEFQIRRPGDGKLFEIHSIAEYDASSRTVFGVIHDITERKSADRALRESNYLLERAQELARLGSYRFDIAEGTWTSSEQMDEIFGIGPGYVRDFAGWLGLVAPEQREDMDSYVKEQVIGRRRRFDREYPIVRPSDGQVRWVAGMGELELDAAGRPAVLIGTIQDITERRRAEQVNRLQSNALDAAANAIVITDRNGVIEWANAAFAAFTGYTLSEVKGRKHGDLLRSGRQETGFYQAMWSTISSGAVWHGEVTNRRKDGTLYTSEMTITPIKDENGAITQYIAVEQDITQRKMLEEQFRQSQKMEAVGLLAGGVAHDFNNILAAVLMQLELVEEDPTLSATVKTSLRELGREIRRGSGLTRQLLAFSRQQPMEIKSMDLNQVINRLHSMLARLLGEHIAILRRGALSGLLIQADEGMVEQVVINLCINARDAMPGGGSLTLSTVIVEQQGPLETGKKEGVPGRYVCLSISDTGCGIPEANLAHIFEPFFTTKEVGKGTGLGLATVYGILKQHHGWITVESAVGVGSTFHVYFPLGPAAAKTASLQAGPVSKGRGETILLVEDEVGLRGPVASTLRRNGYKVFEASNGPAALELWKMHGTEISLLLTDMIMPQGMSGLDLIARIREDRSELKVVVCTGYDKGELVNQMPSDVPYALLRKPYDRSQLLAVVRSCLDGVPVEVDA